MDAKKNESAATTPSSPLATGIVTVMFTDICDSTKLKPLMPGDTTARRDATFRERIKKPHDAIVLPLVNDNHGGVIVNPTGDGYCFSFPDAEEAVLCAVRIQEAFAAQPIDTGTDLGVLKVKVGLHTGFAQASGGDYIASTVDKAARVQAQAKGGQVLLSRETHHHVLKGVRGVSFKSAGKFNLKGLDEDELFFTYRTGAAEPESVRASEPAAPRPFNVPFARNPFFTGREDVLAQLRDALTQTKTAALSQPKAIAGMGGIGKTQTAVEYAYRFRDEYAAVLWTAGESEAALTAGLAELARVLDLPERDAQEQSVAVSAVHGWLDANAGYLLIVDNVDDLWVARKFLPQNPKGHVLMTTRLTVMAGLAQPVSMDRMTEDEGAALLLKRAGKDALTPQDITAAREISKELGGLPLALELAGAFIEEAHSSPVEYLALCRKHGPLLREDDKEIVQRTFLPSFERLELRSPAAADLLRLCAMLAPDAIPEEILIAGAAELGEALGFAAAHDVARAQVIGEACRTSLLRRDADAQTLTIHRLVQEVVRDGMNKRTQRLWAERAVRVVSCAFPFTDFTNWPSCERLLPHARVCAKHVERNSMTFEPAARLLNQMGTYLHDRALFAEAEPLYRRALNIREKALGPDHLGTATSLNNLAGLLKDQGKLREAEPLYRRALATHEKALGPDHPHTAISLNNLARLLRALGKLAELEPLYRRALDIREKALGPDHPDTATSLSSLAELLQDQAKLTEAEPLFRRAFAIVEKVQGPDHPNTANSLNNLAGLLHDQDKLTEAEPLFRRALAIREKALGPNHPRTGTSLNNLAMLLRAEGKLAEAEPLCRRALKIAGNALGAEHPNTVTCCRNLALLLQEQGKLAEAEPLFRRALALAEKALGPNHPHVATVLENLAVLLRETRRAGEAKALEARARAVRERNEG